MSLDKLMPRPESAAQPYRIVELLEAILAEQVKQTAEQRQQTALLKTIAERN